MSWPRHIDVCFSWWVGLAVVLPLAAVIGEPAAAAERLPVVLEITTDTKLDPQVAYGQIVVKASGVVIDGNGAVLVGPAAAAGKPAEYQGVAVLAEGVSDVTLRNVKARGWETGLVVRDGSGWLIEGCDFSDNFHDPAFGWGENGRRGGILLERVSESTLRGNRANRVWDACVLVESNDNRIEGNDFSHTSNTCLKLWTSCRNTVEGNTLTHGIRIDPGEVHARDSTCVLIESGSNHNHFLDNDCTHGGDGIFVRVLNGWNSTGNLFQGNDCSHANNNGVECWAPGNTFVGNTANHCSYGFWLGGSDRTRLIGNQASFNGLPSGPHNSPHLPGGGHAGIVFLFGSSSHVLARGNRCEGNHGAGLALVGDLAEGGPAWKAEHWVIEGNTLVGNRQGIYAQHADWVVLSGNRFEGNGADGETDAAGLSGDLVTQGEVTRLIDLDQTARRKASEPAATKGLPAEGMQAATSPLVSIAGPTHVIVGDEASFGIRLDRALEHPVPITWDAGSGELAEASGFSRSFDTAGVATVAANVVVDGRIEPLAATVFVTDPGTEIGTEGDAIGSTKAWRITDFQDRTESREQVSQAEFAWVASPHVSGDRALAVEINPYAGFRAVLTYPAEGSLDLPIADAEQLSFWLKAINADTTGWQGGPFLMLHGTDGSICHLEPAEGRDLMRELQPGEKADDWRLFRVPLRLQNETTEQRWQRSGDVPQRLKAISIAVDSWGAPPLKLWLDGLMLQD
jgi:parallel beta-helix repeat protein